jgi:hypothetical protein
LPGDGIVGRVCLVVKLCGGAGDWRLATGDVSAGHAAFNVGGSFSAVEDNGCRISKLRGSTLLHNLTTHKAELSPYSHLCHGL